MSAKTQYKTLLKSGILLELYPDILTGIWEEDKHEFEKIYEMEEFYTNNLNIEDGSYEEF